MTLFQALALGMLSQLVMQTTHDRVVGTVAAIACLCWMMLAVLKIIEATIG